MFDPSINLEAAQKFDPLARRL